MKRLRLPLKTKWFEMTKEEIKKEDYREITPYWCARLCLFNGKKLRQNKWAELLDLVNDDFLCLMKLGDVSFKPFNFNEMTKGYPKDIETDRIINFEHKGIEIGYGKPEWGAELDKMYFIIKHGKLIQ